MIDDGEKFSHIRAIALHIPNPYRNLLAIVCTPGNTPNRLTATRFNKQQSSSIGNLHNHVPSSAILKWAICQIANPTFLQRRADSYPILTSSSYFGFKIFIAGTVPSLQLNSRDPSFNILWQRTVVY